MPSILIIGIIIFVGFLSGEILKKFGLPKVTGFILGGLLLNPGLFKIIPAQFIQHTDLITNISLSFITFSVGGTLLIPKVMKMGKSILTITFFEAELAFLMVFLGFLWVTPLVVHIPSSSMISTFIPLSLLISCLASPTDPSASLAVIHEYKAKGTVSSAIMGVAAFDDVLGIINYSFAMVLALTLIKHEPFNMHASILRPFVMICGAMILGIVAGMALNFLTNVFKKETEGTLIVIVFGMLFLCFGMAKYLNYDELLSSMSMGVVVVNFNASARKIFLMLERYTEEFIFVLFFTISGMQLNFSVFSQSAFLILLFFVFRTIGKFLGAYWGAVISHADEKVRRFTAGGLIPQGGIVIGLALLIQQEKAFGNFSELIMGVIIGSTVIHEFIGPLTSKFALRKAKEID